MFFMTATGIPPWMLRPRIAVIELVRLGMSTSIGIIAQSYLSLLPLYIQGILIYLAIHTSLPFPRLISERTVEENILKKANQKRMLGDMAIEGGNFTTAYFKQVQNKILWSRQKRTFVLEKLPLFARQLLL